ncbi:hypothetical protein Taro_045737, partial [Colocasia esculenta]|nr:hypothetical protein [Colocasia esculenta]
MQRSNTIRHVEKDYLRRQDRPHFHIRDKYLKKYFLELAIHVINVFQARDKLQKRPLAQVEFEHADTPPISKKSASKKRARDAAIDPPSSYEWWSDFVHACGLPQDAPPDSLLPSDTFNDDLAKDWIVYLSSVLTSLGTRREAFLVQRARNTVSPSCRLAQPETRVRPIVSLPVPSSEVANSPHDGAVVNTLLIYLPVPSLVLTASSEPLLSSLLSKDQNVEHVPLVSEARGEHSREDDVDDWDYELD